MTTSFADVDQFPVSDVALAAEALDLVNELWPVDGVYKTLSPEQWKRLRRVLLTIPTLVES